MNITDAQLDALTELINIGVGRAAGILNQMIQFPVQLEVPEIRILSVDEFDDGFKASLGERNATVQLGFSGRFSGNAALVFPTDSANKLVSILTGGETSEDMDSVTVGTLNEVGNIVINGIMGSISNILKERLDYSLPEYRLDSIANLIEAGTETGNSMVLMGKTHFSVEQSRIEGEILLLFELGSFDVLLAGIDGLLQASA